MKLTSINLIAVLWACDVIIASQYNYKLEHHYVELIYADKELFTEAKVFNVKPNRTLKAYSGKFCSKIDLTGPTFKVNVHGYYKYSSLQDTPIAFDVGVCDAMATNMFGIDNVLNYGNLTKCPIKKGCYAVDNWVIEETELPPYLPPKKYLFKFKVYLFKTLLAEAHWHGEVKKVFRKN